MNGRGEILSTPIVSSQMSVLLPAQDSVRITQHQRLSGFKPSLMVIRSSHSRSPTAVTSSDIGMCGTGDLNTDDDRWDRYTCYGPIYLGPETVGSVHV